MAKLWEFIHARHIYEPYYDETNMDMSMAEASSRFTDLMIEKVPIHENENFIDIGCGWSAFDNRLCCPAIIKKSRQEESIERLLCSII